MFSFAPGGSLKIVRIGWNISTANHAYKLKRLLAGRWVAQKALRWNVLFWFDEHAVVLFTLALLSGFFYKRSDLPLHFFEIVKFMIFEIWHFFKKYFEKTIKFWKYVRKNCTKFSKTFKILHFKKCINGRWQSWVAKRLPV